MRTVPKISQLAATFCMSLLSLTAAAQCSFRTLNLHGEASAIGINDKGAIVGAILDSSGSHGFLLFNGRFAKFRFPGSNSTEANGINNHGVIVGDYDNPSGQHGFMVVNGAFRSINAPGASATRALGINNF
jgi:uncharacterized membrane protein